MGLKFMFVVRGCFEFMHLFFVFVSVIHSVLKLNILSVILLDRLLMSWFVF